MQKTLERIAEIRAKELLQSEALWYVSFAKSEGGFQGAVLVSAHGVVTALERINQLGINPGGSAVAVPFPAHVHSNLTDRLLSRAELEAAFGELESIPNTEPRVCADCNGTHGPGICPK